MKCEDEQHSKSTTKRETLHHKGVVWVVSTLLQTYCYVGCLPCPYIYSWGGPNVSSLFPATFTLIFEVSPFPPTDTQLYKFFPFLLKYTVMHILPINPMVQIIMQVAQFPPTDTHSHFPQQKCLNWEILKPIYRSHTTTIAPCWIIISLSVKYCIKHTNLSCLCHNTENTP